MSFVAREAVGGGCLESSAELGRASALAGVILRRLLGLCKRRNGADRECVVVTRPQLTTGCVVDLESRVVHIH